MRRVVNFWVGVGLAHPPMGAPESFCGGLAVCGFVVVNVSPGPMVGEVCSGRIFRRAAVVSRMPP